MPDGSHGAAGSALLPTYVRHLADWATINANLAEITPTKPMMRAEGAI